LTSVKVQASQPEEAARGEVAQAARQCRQSSVPAGRRPFLGEGGATGSPRGLTALQAARRQPM